jgi:hypothetical protein
MNSVQRIKIKLEKHELKVIRLGRQRKFFCEICQSETQHLTVSQMSTVLEITELNAFRLAVDGRFHLFESADGKLMLCADSVANFGKIK